MARGTGRPPEGILETGNIAVQPGFARAIAGTGPVFIAFLIPHILAGLTALSSGAAVIASRKGTRWHVRAGATYFWAIALLASTAAGLTAVRGSRDLPVFVLGVLALALAPGRPGVASLARARAAHLDHDQLVYRHVDRIPGRQRQVSAADWPTARSRQHAAPGRHRGATNRLGIEPPPMA